MLYKSEAQNILIPYTYSQIIEVYVRISWYDTFLQGFLPKMGPKKNKNIKWGQEICAEEKNLQLELYGVRYLLLVRFV